jgi:hypothetical protein
LPLSALVDQLPLSLQTAALSIPLRKADHERLVTAKFQLARRMGGLNASIIPILISSPYAKWSPFPVRQAFAQSSSQFAMYWEV